VTFFQQCAVFRCQIVNQRVHTVPEGGDVNASTGNGLLIDEVIKNPGNLEITNLDAITHENPSLFGETAPWRIRTRSEEHTSELQSRENLVCRLLLEKKKKKQKATNRKTKK